jgi:hypothetical protein
MLMIRYLIPVLALLLIAIRPAPANESWEFNFRKCHIEKRLPQGEYIASGTFFLNQKNEAVIVIDSGEIDELEKAVPCSRNATSSGAVLQIATIWENRNTAICRKD